MLYFQLMEHKNRLVSAALAVGFAVLYLNGLPAVPFHPDESSWIYMSADFSRLLLHHDWAELVWVRGQASTASGRLRLLNGPMMQYFIGLSDWLHGLSTADLNSDWVWGAPWEDNVGAGHLPSPRLLLASRVPAAVLSALAVAMLFLIVQQLRGAGTGLVAALLFGLNPLVMLHGRRAMAEGALLFFSMLAVWGLLSLVQWVGKRGGALPKLGALSLGVGALIGLAVATKQTAIGLLPTAVAAVSLPMLRGAGVLGIRRRVERLVAVWLALGLGCALAFWALNPVLYVDPLGGLQALVADRVDMVHQQTLYWMSSSPDLVTADVSSRLRAAVMELYFHLPAVWDVPIYLDQLGPQADAYFAQPVEQFTVWPIWGIAMLALGIVGWASSAVRLWRDRRGKMIWGEQTLWWWLTGIGGVILLTTPFAWQRYFILLVALVCVFAALGLERLVQPLANRVVMKKMPKLPGR
jgi:hypothetical protein